MVVLGLWLDSMVFKVFSNLNGSVILWYLLEIAVFLWQRGDAPCCSGHAHRAGCGHWTQSSSLLRGGPMGLSWRDVLCRVSIWPHRLVRQPALSDGVVGTGPTDANEVSASQADLGRDVQAEGETLTAPLRNSSHTRRVQAAPAG